MSQLNQVRDLVDKLVQASQKVHIQPELNVLIEQLAQTILNRSSSQSSKSPYTFPIMSEFDTNLVNFEAISESLDQIEVINMTQAALNIFEMMKIIIQYSLNTKKPQQSQVQGVNQILNNKIHAIAKNYPNHASLTKVIHDGLQAVYWVFNDQPKNVIDSAIENLAFSSQKVKEQNNDLLSKWVCSFNGTLQSLSAYTQLHFSNGLTWNFKGDGDFSDLISQLRTEIKITLDRSLVTHSTIPQQQPQAISQVSAQQAVKQAPIEVLSKPIQEQHPPEPIQQVQQIVSAPAPVQNDTPSPQVQQASPVQQIAINYPAMTDFEKHVNDFISAGESLDEEVKELTSLTVKAFQFMKVIMTYSKKLKKPQQENLKEIQKCLNEKVFKPINFSKAGIKFPNHLKTSIQGISAIAWVISETPKMNLDNGIESSEFYGNKILMMKQAEHTAWYNSFKAALKSLVPYVLINFNTGLLWNFSGSDDYTELYQILKGEKQIESVSSVSPSTIQVPQAFIPSPPAAPAQSQPSYPPLTDFEKNLADFTSAYEKLEDELQDLSKFVVKTFDMMKVIMSQSKSLKKPGQGNIKQIQTIFNDKVFKPINSSKAGIKYPNHLKTAIQGLSAVLWVINDVPKIALDNGIESSEFYGNKILLMKQPEHTAWNNSFKATLKSLVPYVLMNFTTGLLWSFNGSDDYSDLYSILKGEKQVEQPQVPSIPAGIPPPPPIFNLQPIVVSDYAPQNDQSDSKSALLNALNVGEDAIKAHLKHVKKGEKYEAKKPSQPQNVPAVNKKQEAPIVFKEPKKYQKDNWFVENYTNERIEFEEGEISLKQSLFIENCNNSTIIIKGKVKSIFVNKCKKTKVLVTNAVSGVEAVDCQSCEVYIAEQVPSIQIDKSDTVRVIFLKEKSCDIVTSKSSGINVTYATNDEGDMEKDTPIPEQFITRWCVETNHFITRTLDTFL